MEVAQEGALILLFIGSVFWAIQVNRARRRAGTRPLDFSGPPEKVWRVLLDHWFAGKAVALGLSSAGVLTVGKPAWVVGLWEWAFLITLIYWFLAQTLALRVWQALPPADPTGNLPTIGPQPTQREREFRGEDADGRDDPTAVLAGGERRPRTDAGAAAADRPIPPSR